MLLWSNPELAGRSCDDCRRWWYDETTGKPFRRPAHDGPFVPRPADCPTPCNQCQKVPEGVREEANRIRLRLTGDAAVEMGPREWQVYNHYLQCKATGRFPDDPIVSQHAGLIRQLEDARAVGGVLARLDAILRLIVAGGGRG